MEGGVFPKRQHLGFQHPLAEILLIEGGELFQTHRKPKFELSSSPKSENAKKDIISSGFITGFEHEFHMLPIPQKQQVFKGFPQHRATHSLATRCKVRNFSSFVFDSRADRRDDSVPK